MRAAGIVGVLLGLCGPILTGPAASAQAGQPGIPVAQCTIADKRLGELSGLVVDGDRWYAVNDGGTRSRIYVLNRDCRVERVITGPTDPFDVEDLALGPDGTFWLSDTGDNDAKRKTVALINLTDSGESTLHRLTYPDGAHDSEALLVDQHGVPYLISKNPLGSAGVYRPVGQLASPGPTALKKVGTVEFRPTGTPGGPVPGVVGSVVVTGAGATADGRVVALRTYTDAYLFPVRDGDLLAALGGEPVRVPLPNEAQGEAVAFEPDGALLSASEGVGQPIRAVSGAADLAVSGASQPQPAPDGEPTPAGQPGPPGDTGAASGDQPGGQDGLPTAPGALVTVVIIGGIMLIMRRRAARRG